MKKPIFTPFPILTTKRLVLRQLDQSDKNEIFSLRADAKNRKFIDQKIAEKMEEALEFINKINNGINSNEWIYWAVTLKGENKLLGTICLWNFSTDYKKAETGYELNPDYQGKGIMQEALGAVIHYAFDILEINEIEAYTHVDNMSSKNLLEKNNFTKRGIIKEKYQSKKGEFDMAIYVLENRTNK
jgi:ribosomal-protein-alanine N-acetyltransferase